jgi:ParB family chromosome partitioning protein
MAIKKRGLGRGLNALLGGMAEVKELTDPRPEPISPSSGASTSSNNELRHLPVELIQRGIYQPRVHFEPESLQELADSIKAQGVVQPIVVRPISAGRFELIAGERRWRASQLAGLHEIPAVVKDLSDQAAAAVSLIENIQRENLNPLEESRALQRLIDEFDMTHQQVAEAVSRSRTTVTNLLRLRDLNEDVKLMVDQRKLDMGHARALLALTGHEQSLLAGKAAEQGWSVRETEKKVKQQLNPALKVSEASAKTDPDIRRLQEQVSERLGAQVEVQHKNNGRGKLVINYSSLDELDGILNKIH